MEISSGSRASTIPTVPVRAADSATAAELGWKPSSAASSSTRRRVASLTPARPFRAYETDALEMSRARAMSLIVGRERGVDTRSSLHDRAVVPLS